MLAFKADPVVREARMNWALQGAGHESCTPFLKLRLTTNSIGPFNFATEPALHIVEDDPAMSAGLRDNFEIERFTVVTASPLFEAKQLLLNQ